MAEVSRQQVLDSVKSSFTSGKYSDLVITCGADSYNVHKVVVCTRADFFARAIDFGGKEASEDRIDLPDDDPAIVKLLVQYLYEGEYEPRLPTSEAATGSTSGFDILQTETRSEVHHKIYTYDFPHTCRRFHGKCKEYCVCPHHVCIWECGSTCEGFICDKCTRPSMEGEANQLMTYAKMYEVADKYDVVGLKDLSREKFDRGCISFWNDDAFPTAAHYAFSTTVEEDKGLRDIVSGTISAHMELIRKAEIQALMTEFNGLALSILLKKADEHGWGSKVTP